MTVNSIAHRAPIRVYVVDDHPIFRFGVADLLAAESDMLWVGESDDGAEAVRAAPALRPDVVLIDLVMPGMDPVEAVAALRAELPHAHFVAMTCTPDATATRRAVAAGAVGVLLKNASSQELLTVIHAAHRGRSVMSPELTDALVAAEQSALIGADLTRRERTLLELMARGLPNQEISQRLAIAMPTVKFHITNILAKLHAENRTSAVLTALRHKIVSLA